MTAGASKFPDSAKAWQIRAIVGIVIVGGRLGGRVRAKRDREFRPLRQGMDMGLDQMGLDREAKRQQCRE